MTPLDLSHGGKDGAPNREARRKGEPPRKHPQGVPVPSKVMIDEEGGNKADAGSKGEEGHHPPRAVTSRCGLIDVNRSTERRVRDKRNHMPAQSENTEPAPHGTCGSIKKDTER